MKGSYGRSSILSSLVFFLVTGLVAEQPAATELKTPIEWFQRANDQMNIRLPGSRPFHLKVTFHAYEGMELLGKKKSPQIVTGDGVYEETWVAPHTWRREATLADYHAVEVEGSGGRKMQASSDYEPSRVLMLLSALLAPIPRNLTSTEFKHDSASDWKIDFLQNQTPSLVRIGKAGGSEKTSVIDGFFFLPHGLLVFRNEKGLLTRWENDVLFGGRVVPRRLTVIAGDRTLLTADVTIDEAGPADSAIFDLPGKTADPGMTLRPIHEFEARMPDLLVSHTYMMTGGTRRGSFTLWTVMDRHGRYREVELLNVIDPANADEIMDQMRGERHDAPTIDGNPCQVPVGWVMY